MPKRFTPHATYSRGADAIYVALASLPVDHTTSLDDCRMIDVAADGRVIGVEFLAVSDGVDLSDVPSADVVEELINKLDAPVPARER
jgi:uncharacterized protein YuzE